MRTMSTFVTGMLVVMVTACGAGPSDTPVTAEPETVAEPAAEAQERLAAEAPEALIGPVFMARTIEGEPVSEEVRSSLRFEAEGRVFGNAGCNSFRGTYEIDGSSISFGPLAATKMMCPPDVMEQETAFLQALERVRSFGFDDDGFLQLAAEDGASSRFEPVAVEPEE